jgi:hypothetical protein
MKSSRTDGEPASVRPKEIDPSYRAFFRGFRT